MSKPLSVYLDLLRLLSALTVMVSHVVRFAWPHGPLSWLEDFGHPAVMIFFVLSGYVIGFVATEREHGLLEFSTSRLARLYSVVLPALLLTVVLDEIGMAIDPSVYDPGTHDLPSVRLFAAATFLSSIWFFNIQPLSNSPFWSLPYEAWYYVAFACALYLRGTVRVFCLVLAVLVMGPKILMYAPIWLGGVALQRFGRHWNLGRPAPGLFVLSAIGFLALIPLGAMTRHETRFLPFGFSSVDYLMAVMVLLHIWAAQCLRLDRLLSLARPVQRSAVITFSLYLFHLPIVFFLLAILPRTLSPASRVPIIMAATLGAIIVFTGPTEILKR